MTAHQVWGKVPPSSPSCKAAARHSGKTALTGVKQRQIMHACQLGQRMPEEVQRRVTARSEMEKNQPEKDMKIGAVPFLRLWQCELPPPPSSPFREMPVNKNTN